MLKPKSCITLAAGLAALNLPQNLDASNGRKSIILILTDQQTASAMSCAGNRDLNTPNMDRIAARGTVFGNAYCTAPLSGPSRAALFTGCYPDGLGMIRNGAPLPDSLKTSTLGSIVKAVGYECAYAGKWHVNEPSIPDKIYGFDNIYPHNDIGLAESVVDFLKREHAKPFFLVASFDNPHNICEYAREQNLPWGEVESPRSLDECPQLPANHVRNADDADVVLMEKAANYNLYPTIRYSDEQWRRYRYAYYRLVEKADAEIGKILDEIDRQNLWEDAVVIFTSDHGDGIGAHQWNQKSALYEEVVNVPLIVADADCATSGTVSDAIVSNGIDLFKTILDYADAQSPRNQGVSIRPGRKERDYAICETTFDRGTTRGWMVRTKRFKYVLYDKGAYREQFFDILEDRGETSNLADEPEYREELLRHRDILYEWMKNNNVRASRNNICDVPGKESYTVKR